MQEELFQSIFNILEPFLPTEWKKLIFFAGYTEGSYTMKYYTGNDNNEYIDCFRQNGVDKQQLVRVFMDIDKKIAQERSTLDDKHRWSVMTMIVDSDGNMRTEFDYSDISEDAIAFEQSWKQKYIQ